MSPNKRSRSPRRVDFVNEHQDMDCAILGALGFSTWVIADKTGLSVCQVQYRLRAACIKRAMYRDGTNVIAQKLLANPRILGPVVMEVESDVQTHPHGYKKSDVKKAVKHGGK